MGTPKDLERSTSNLPNVYAFFVLMFSPLVLPLPTPPFHTDKINCYCIIIDFFTFVKQNAKDLYFILERVKFYNGIEE